MTRLDEIPVGESITACIYGPAGSGKTYMMGTAGNRTLYCNIENRLATLQSKEYQRLHPFNPFTITVHEEHLPDGGAKALVELNNQINNYLDSNLNDFDIIIVDGATSLRRFAMNMGLELNQKSGKSKSLANKKSFSPDYPAVDIAVNDYQMEMSLIENWIYMMKELCIETKKHFFLTAHERVEFNPPSKLGQEPTVRSIKPGFTGQKFPDTIPGMFDIVWHTETKGGGERITYYARTAGDDSLIAKTCYSGFSTLEPNPNIQNILKRIKG